MRGASFNELITYWPNPIIRQWIISNILEDDKIKDNTFRLQILATNPTLYKELYKERNINDIQEKIAEHLKTRKPGKVDDKTKASIEKFRQQQQRFLDEDSFSLTDDDGVINAATDAISNSTTED